MSTQNQREITIYATRGGKTEKILTDVTTWGALRPLVRKAGYDVDGLLAAESFTKHDLVNDLALLPVENFRLFLRPKQTKSGAEMSYKELRASISEFIQRDGDKAKNHFNSGKNYTTKGTEELRSLYNGYKGNKGAKASAPVKEVVQRVKEVVKSVKESKSSNKVNPLVDILSSLRNLPYSENIDEAIELLEADLNGGTSKAIKVETEEEFLAREARELGY